MKALGVDKRSRNGVLPHARPVDPDFELFCAIGRTRPFRRCLAQALEGTDGPGLKWPVVGHPPKKGPEARPVS